MDRQALVAVGEASAQGFFEEEKSETKKELSATAAERLSDRGSPFVSSFGAEKTEMKFERFELPLGGTSREIGGASYVRDFHGNFIPERKIFRESAGIFLTEPSKILRAFDAGLEAGPRSASETANRYGVFFCNQANRVLFFGYVSEDLRPLELGRILAQSALRCEGYRIAVVEDFANDPEIPKETEFLKRAKKRMSRIGWIFPTFGMSCIDWIGRTGFAMGSPWSLRTKMPELFEKPPFFHFPRGVFENNPGELPEGYRRSGEFIERKKPKTQRYSSPIDVHERLSPELVFSDREIFLAYFLDDKNRMDLPGYESHGGPTETYVSAFSMFRNFFLSGRSKMVCVHNHPTGRVSPSEQDNRLGVAIGIGCEALELELTDFLVVGHEAVASLLPEILSRVQIWRGSVNPWPD